MLLNKNIHNINDWIEEKIIFAFSFVLGSSLEFYLTLDELQILLDIIFFSALLLLFITIKRN